MKKTLFYIFIGFLVSCTPKATVTTIPDAAFEQLDTMVITAPRVQNEVTGFRLPTYRASAKRENDLLHTKLDIKFDWEKEQVIGTATLTLKPYFAPMSSVTLDAKGFEFSKVKMLKGKELDYNYDGQQIKINLDAVYKRDAEYTIVLDYIATPAASGGSDAITSDKGLFFINPRQENPNKPTQIWTQGETEHNSRWFPTIDKPNERCTQELYVTVQDKYKTLSNGILVNSKAVGNGMRRDYWKMDKPHAPYLFALVVGDYAIVKDKWKNIDVDYYVEPEYEPYARNIFPYTPEMLTFFSDVLDYQYPWQKYSQVVVRDYVSGAMENTTAVIFGEFMQGTDRDLIDELKNEKIVAHEMMHHWFGDYVTCESWSNLTLNEGFANYSEYLWLEHKYGRDEADAHRMEEFAGYLEQARSQGIHDLINFSYEDKEDMFDAHSYNKGGMVLHMLRDYLGDEAFFASLNKYLADNAYTAVEVDELRMAFEDTSGEDLNWFFNQWYRNQGHPNLEFSKYYNAETGNLEVTVMQTQDAQRMPAIFELPIDIDIYYGAATKTRENIRVTNREQTFLIPVTGEPKFVDIDPNKVLLAEIVEDKTPEEYIFQYQNTKSFSNRLESVKSLKEENTEAAKNILQASLQDDYWMLRLFGVYSVEINEQTLPIIEVLAKNDVNSKVRSIAVNKLGALNDSKYIGLFSDILKNERAYNVQGASLVALRNLDLEAALKAAKQLEKSENGKIIDSVSEIYVESGDPKYLPFFEEKLDKVDNYEAISVYEKYGAMVAKSGKASILPAANRLSEIGANMVVSPYRRFAAVKTINDLYLWSNDQAKEEKTEATKTEWLVLKDKLVDMIKSIKAKETDSQLKMFYNSFPTPIQP